MVALLAISSTCLSQEFYSDRRIEDYSKYAKFNSAQEYALMERSNNLTYNGESNISEIQVSVTDEFNLLTVKVDCKLIEGELLVEVINPNSEVKGNFTVIKSGVFSKGNNTQSEETVVGQIEKHFRNPIAGIWIIRLSPKNATGSASIYNALIFNQKADLLEIDQIRRDTNANIKHY